VVSHEERKGTPPTREAEDHLIGHSKHPSLTWKSRQKIEPKRTEKLYQAAVIRKTLYDTEVYERDGLSLSERCFEDSRE